MVFESDNFSLVSYLRMKTIGFNFVFGVIEDISRLALSLFSIRWSFVKRLSSVVVHELARAEMSDGEKLWWGCVPPTIAPYVLSDFFSI